MSAIDNAVSLMADGTLLEKIKAVSVYQARAVAIEPVATAQHAVRMKLATDVIYNPVMHAVRFQNVLACDDAICGSYSSGSNIPDSLLISKMSDIWTPIAVMLYPTG
jgi:hypothetical protein